MSTIRGGFIPKFKALYYGRFLFSVKLKQPFNIIPLAGTRWISRHNFLFCGEKYQFNQSVNINYNRSYVPQSYLKCWYFSSFLFLNITSKSPMWPTMTIIYISLHRLLFYVPSYEIMIVQLLILTFISADLKVQNLVAMVGKSSPRLLTKKSSTGITMSNPTYCTANIRQVLQHPMWKEMCYLEPITRVIP